MRATRTMSARSLIWLVALSAATSLWSACNAERRGRHTSGDAGAQGDAAADLSIPIPTLDLPPTCEGLACRQVECSGGATTTLSGRVYTPAGDLPLYNVTVYVPNGDLEPFPPGVVCGACDAMATGKPLVATLTAADGQFKLEDVPVGDDIPLVYQIGRWRRRVVVPHVEACADNKLPLGDRDLQRLPRDQSEGDLPQMAIATGSADPFECLLRKIGIADSEFTGPDGGGRVHVYRQNGLDTDPPAPSGDALWGSLDQLEKYDVVILPCEGEEVRKTPDALQHLVDYTTAGGRVFATHYSYTWIAFAPQPFPSTGDWDVSQHTPSPDPFPGIVDTSFPKGAAFAEWLQNVGATLQLGQIKIEDPRHDIDRVNPLVAQRWISGPNNVRGVTSNVLLHMTFNTPIDLMPAAPGSGNGGAPDGGGGDGGAPLQCGRVVFSDFHVSTDAISSSRTPFPAACKNDTMTAQERALTFMLFDLSACVQKDDEPPEPPIQ